MNITVLVPSTPAAAAATHDASIAAQLNSVLRRSGLHLATAATQLHVAPETVYAVSDNLVAFLSRHADILVSHESVHCDFNALSAVLWDRIKKAEDQIDVFLQETQGTEGDRFRVFSMPHLPKPLLLLAQALRILRHADEPFARPEVYDAVPVIQKDVDMVIRISLKIVRILESTLAHLKEVDVRFIRAAQILLANAELYLATIAARPVVDVAPFLSFISDESTWRLSGAGAYATDSYCEALSRLVCALFSRPEPFPGAAARSADLLLRRLAHRPPFCAEIFRALHASRDEPATAAYGLLHAQSAVLRRVEALLLSDRAWAPALRRECARRLRAAGGERALLSFPQALVLAAARGMPAVDLTDDAELRRRARETALAGPAECAAAGRPALLRLLLAHGFAAGPASPAGGAGGALSRASVVALARAFATEVLQLPKLRGEAQPALDALRLRAPVIAERLAQFVRDAAVASGAAAEVLGEMREASSAVFAASAAQCAVRLAADRIAPNMRRFAVLAADLLALFVDDEEFVEAAATPHVALEVAAHVYALRTFYVESLRLSTAIAQQRIAALAARLATIAQLMPRAELTGAFSALLLPCASAEFFSRRNRQEYALLEAYTRAFATEGAALAIDETTMLRHWVDVALRCAMNAISGALALAGVDMLTAAFHSRREIVPLFVPTYVALLVPIARAPPYGEPPLFLVRHFAKGVRAACQALEACDAEALAHRLADSASPLATMLAETAKKSGAVSLDSVKPISSVLLVVSALFDKISALLMGYDGSGSLRKERHVRFQIYFSGLINLLRCRVSAVLHRVCASIEAVMLEHLQDVGTAQAQWMKYIGMTVDDVSGNSKTYVAEWFLGLSQRMSEVIGQSHL